MSNGEHAAAKRAVSFLQRAAKHFKIRMDVCRKLYLQKTLREFRLSVCPSVCHTPVLCQNDGT